MRIRDYRTDDEPAWLRCRVLAFLATCYFDDVKTAKTPNLAHSLVAEVDGELVGLLDLDVDGDAATIDTIAVHPDHVRRGVGSGLLAEALRRVSGCRGLDAWTRDDLAARDWYRRNDFVEVQRYLHVYADGHDETATAVEPRLGLRPMTGFFHAPIDHEAELRRRFRRVHSCRRYLRRLPQPDDGSRG